MPKISIIAPIYNVEEYIGNCIDSILSQTFTDWELILVDDCGHDSSMSIVKNYCQRDSRIRYIESEGNVGPMLAREKGYNQSTGDYIAFVDSDDTLPNNALYSLYQSAILSNADIIVGESIQIGFKGEKTSYLPLGEYKEWGKKEVFMRMLTLSFPHTLWGKLFKSGLLQDKGIKNYKGLTNAEDAYLFYQLVEKANKIATIKDIVYYYWMHEKSSTNKPLTYNAVNSMAIFGRFQYGLLKTELGEIDKKYYTSLYLGISNVAKRYPYRSVKAIYKKNGVNINMSLFNLLRYFSLFGAIKVFIKAHLYYLIFHK